MRDESKKHEVPTGARCFSLDSTDFRSYPISFSPVTNHDHSRLWNRIRLASILRHKGHLSQSLEYIQFI